MPGSTPLAPTKLAATAGNGQVSLTWNPVNNAYSYNVYRSTTPGGEGSAPVATGWNGYTDSGLTNGTTYYYTVTAVNEDGEGAASNEASATPSVPPLPAPALSATAASGQASLTWTAVAGASSYNLYRYGGGNDWNWTLLQVGLTSTSDTDTGLTDGTTYQYSVCAVSKDGQGSQSNQVSVLPGGPALALAAHVVWTRDYTASPPTQTASTAGTFGGNATLHLTLTGPQTLGWGGAATATVRVHEVAAPDASGDLVWTDVPLYGSPSAACGEPSSVPPALSSAYYLDVPWGPGGFNGNYVVTATVQASVGNSASPQTVTLPSPLTVEREDLLITGTSPSSATTNGAADPSAFAWAPGMAPLSFSASVMAAYRANDTLTLTIRDSEQNIEKAVTQSAVIGGGSGATTTPLTWDGTDGSGNPAPLGVYQYQVDVSCPATGDTDTSRSKLLSIPSTAVDFTDSDAANYYYTFSYTLQDASNTAATAGQIWLYDADMQKVMSWDVSTLPDQANGGAMSGLQAGASGTPHTVVLKVPITAIHLAGDFRFMLHVADGHAGGYKGHSEPAGTVTVEEKPALDENKRRRIDGPISYISSGGIWVAWAHHEYDVNRVIGTILPAVVAGPKDWAYAAVGLIPGQPLLGAAAWNGKPYTGLYTTESVAASINGIFDYADYPASVTDSATIKTVVPVGDINGLEWSIVKRARDSRWSFGMAQTGNSFLAKHMVLDQKRRQWLADPQVRLFQYNCSDIGPLIVNGIPQPLSASEKYGGGPFVGSPTERTAFAWNASGDFFLIVFDSSDWKGVRDFIKGLPTSSFLSGYGAYHLGAITNAFMLDGGGSSQMGYVLNEQSINQLFPLKPDPNNTDTAPSGRWHVPSFFGLVWP